MKAANKSPLNSLSFSRGQGEVKNQTAYLLLPLIIILSEKYFIRIKPFCYLGV
jgi:hypothetical protein